MKIEIESNPSLNERFKTCIKWKFNLESTTQYFYVFYFDSVIYYIFLYPADTYVK